jgi:hypothetical protein
MFLDEEYVEKQRKFLKVDYRSSETHRNALCVIICISSIDFRELTEETISSIELYPSDSNVTATSMCRWHCIVCW